MFKYVFCFLGLNLVTTNSANANEASFFARGNENQSSEENQDYLNEVENPWRAGDSIKYFFITRNTMHSAKELNKLRLEYSMLVQEMKRNANLSVKESEDLLKNITNALKNLNQIVDTAYQEQLSTTASFGDKASHTLRNFFGLGKGIFGQIFTQKITLLEDKATLIQFIAMLNQAIVTGDNALVDIQRCLDSITTWNNFKKVWKAIKDTEQKIDESRRSGHDETINEKYSWFNRKEKQSIEKQLEDLLRFCEYLDERATRANINFQEAFFYRKRALDAITKLTSRNNPQMKVFMDRYALWKKQTNRPTEEKIRTAIESLFSYTESEAYNKLDHFLNPKFTFLGSMGQFSFFPLPRTENFMSKIPFLPGGWVNSPDDFAEYNLRADRLLGEASMDWEVFVSGYSWMYEFITTYQEMNKYKKQFEDAQNNRESGLDNQQALSIVGRKYGTTLPVGK